MNIINKEHLKDSLELHEGETVTASGGGLPSAAAADTSSLFVEGDHTAASTEEESSLVTIQTLQRMKTEIEIVIRKQMQHEEMIVTAAEETFEDDGIEKLEQGRGGKWLYDLGSEKTLFLENSNSEILFLKGKIDRLEKVIDELNKKHEESSDRTKRTLDEQSETIEEVRSLIASTDHTPNHNARSLPVTYGQNNQRMRLSILGRTPTAILGSPDGISLDWDTFSLMMISPVRSSSWILGFSSFGFQMTLGIMILIGQFNQSVNSSIFDVPFKVDDASVRVAQFLAIILCLSTQSDILTSFRSFVLLGKGSNWAEVIGEEGTQPSCSLWITRVGLPNTFKLFQGLVVTFASFVIIVQNKDTIDLLKDFISLMVVSEFDNILFQVAAYGYLGEDLRLQTVKISDGDMIRGTSSSKRRRIKIGFFYVRLAFVVLLSAMFAGWGIIFRMQSKGNIFDKKFPGCGKEHYELAFEKFGDDKCYGGPFNTLTCKYEDGDCANFNTAFPSCNGKDLAYLANVEEEVGNGKCNMNFAIPQCEYDGGDCCSHDIHLSPSLGDGKCNGGLFNTEGCFHDLGDCEPFNLEYPTCTFDDTVFMVESGAKIILGDGICDGGAYNVEQCGFEYGDCMKSQIGGDIVLRGVVSPRTSQTPFRMWMSADGSKLLVELFNTNQFVNYDSNSVGKMSGYTYNSTMLTWVQNETMDKERIQNNEESNIHYYDGVLPRVAMAGDGSTIAVGSPPYDNRKGRVDIFDFWGNSNHQVLTGMEDRAGFGVQVDLTVDGRRIAVSSPRNSSSGKIQIFEKSESQELWTQLGGDIYGKADGKIIGIQYVGLNSSDGTRVFFSASETDNTQLAALRIYQYNGTGQEWVQLGSELPCEPSISFITISEDGNRFAISFGAVTIYDWYPDPSLPNKGSWNQLGPALSSGEYGFGRSISMNADGTFLAISAVDLNYCSEDLCPTGSVQLYQYKSTNPPDRPFSLLPHLRDNNLQSIMETPQQLKDNTILGLQVSLSGDGTILAVSGYDIEQNVGFVKVFNVSELFMIDCLVDYPEMIGDGVCTPFQNIALLPSASAEQSSDKYYGFAEVAIDGNPGSVTHTQDDSNPFWKVVWPALYRIVRVKVWQRTDCCTSRIVGFVLTIRANDEDVWSSETSNVDTNIDEPSYFFDIPGFIDGDEIIIQIFRVEMLSLAEVEVIGYLPYSMEPSTSSSPSISPSLSVSPSTSLLPSPSPSNIPSSPPTLTPTQSPSERPSISAEPTTFTVEVNLELHTDLYPHETSWSLIDNDHADDIVHSGPGDGDTYDGVSLFNFTWTLNRCTSYSFTISDSYGDGVISPGYAEITFEARQVKEALGRVEGNFGGESTISFKICDDEQDN